MKKIIEIDGRKVAFSSNATFLIRYKNQFKRDPISSLQKLSKLFEDYKKAAEIDPNATIDDSFIDMFYEFAWVLAYTADKSTPDLETWLDSFEEFPIIDVFTELQETITRAFECCIKLKK